MKRRVRRIAICFGGLLVLVSFLGAYLVGGRLVAPANHVVGQPPAGFAFLVKQIPGNSGPIGAWLLDHPDSEATVLLLHPIRGDRRNMLQRGALLYQAGFSIVLIDLQAHGESPGDAITMGYREANDVRAAIDYIRERSPTHRLGVVGHSLGGAAALLASPLEIDALVLESVFPTIEEAVHNRVGQRLGFLRHLLAPLLLGQLKFRLDIDARQLRPIEHIASVACPVLVAGGDQDIHTTLAETERLFQRAVEPKELVVFEDAAHVDLLSFSPDLYREKVVDFLLRHLDGLTD